MKNFKTRLFACAAVLGLGLPISVGSASADPLSAPSMSASLSANPNPFGFDLPDWFGDAGGKIYVSGAASGIFLGQTDPVFFDVGSRFDMTNAMVNVQKTDGWLQFFVTGGLYSFPTVGVPYTRAEEVTEDSFGYAPVAYVKLVPNANLSIEAGKLPTLIGDEYGFTFQNLDIERGLLWNNEPIVSRGVQVNYTMGPLTVSASLNDGLYTDTYNVISGLVSYGFNGGADTVAFAGSGNLSGSYHFGTLNAGSVFNLIYTHTSGPLTISPYFQINSSPGTGGSTAYAGAILANYAFTDNWKLAGRVEYETESSGVDLFGYGSGSDAWSITVTPTYQWKVFFARADLSYVGIGGNAPGAGFGSTGNSSSQFRGLIEAGVVF
jgi:hypothetical protein